MKKIHLSQQIPPEMHDLRLDQALARLFPQYSRTQLQSWIQQGSVSVDGSIQLKPREKVKANQLVIIDASINPQKTWEAQEIPLNIIYQDEELIIINKPAQLVVHPGAGNPDLTLVNALLHHFPELKLLPRAGIIHRLDKDTSGLLTIARNLEAHNQLVQAMQKREITREYDAVVHGKIISGGTIDAPIGRDPIHRTRMAVVLNGKPAITHYRIIERFSAHTYIRLQLETGRTHQIRVHMAHINHSLVGDQTYRQRRGVKIGSLDRQALHACRLKLEHPTTKKIQEFTAPLPDDIQQLLDQLRKNNNHV